jgi:acyl carrier protein
MEAMEVKEKILNIIRDISPDEDVDQVDPAISLREQLDLDSMDFLDIVMELRKRHKIEVPQEDYTKLATLNSCVEYLAPKFH